MQPTRSKLPHFVAVAVLTLCTADVRAGRIFDDAEKQALFASNPGVPSGTERDGWVYYADANSANPPPKGAPSQSGWYKKVQQGSTQYWEDKNGNGTKDSGETKAVPFTLYFRTSVDERRIRTDWTQFDPEAALRDALAAQPDARQEKGLSAEVPLVVFGRRCYAAGPCLDMTIGTDVFVVVETGQPMGYGTFGQSWLKSDRKTPGYVMTRFTQPEAVDEAIRALLGEPCGKASAEAALAMLRKWNQLIAARIADGPGFKGLYHPDMSRYFPLPPELPGEWVFRSADSTWGKSLRLQPVGKMPYASLEFRVHTEFFEQPNEPVLRATKQFADDTRGWEPITLAGADEAAKKKTDSVAEWRFRRGNAVASLTVNKQSGEKTNAKATALAQRIAEVVIAKMRGALVPPLAPRPAPKHTILAKQEGSPEGRLGYGGRITLQVLDADGDPVEGEPVTILPADPSVGYPKHMNGLTNNSGEKSVEYVFGKPGVNRLLIESTGGRTTFEAKVGGFLFSIDPEKGTPTGVVKIRVRALDGADLKPMSGLPVRLYVDDGMLPTRGRFEAPPNGVPTDAAGEAVFTYLPPVQQDGVKTGVIKVSASVDESGVKYRFGGTARLAINLPPQGKDKP